MMGELSNDRFCETVPLVVVKIHCYSACILICNSEESDSECDALILQN